MSATRKIHVQAKKIPGNYAMPGKTSKKKEKAFY